MVSNTTKFGGLAGAALIAATLLIVPHEGERLKAYLDPPQVPTICWGHTHNVFIGQVAVYSQCQAFLKEDIATKERCIDKVLRVPMSDMRKAAWLSFTFNVGCGAFQNSTALKDINSGAGERACNDMLAWVCYTVPDGTGAAKGACGTKKRNKSISKELMRRRLDERAVCLKG